MRAKITDNVLNASTLFSTKLKLLTTGTIFTPDSKLMFQCIDLWGIIPFPLEAQMVFSGSATFECPLITATTKGF